MIISDLETRALEQKAVEYTRVLLKGKPEFKTLEDRERVYEVYEWIAAYCFFMELFGKEEER